MTRASNAIRGETTFSIVGKPYVLRPSFEALVAAEQDVGSLFALVERASDGTLTLSEITALLWHCMPVDDRPAREVVGEAVLDIGIVAATQPLRTILGQVLQGRQ